MKILFADSDDACFNCDSLISKWFEAHGGKNSKEAHQQYLKEFCECTELIFPEMAARVSRIVRETGCEIVWTSSWRTLLKYNRIANAREMFNKRGLPGDALLGYTPDYSNSPFYTPRCEEITAFIRQHNKDNTDKITIGVVVDDDPDAGKRLPEGIKFFQTHSDYGMTEAMTNKIIKYLNKENT